MIQLICSLKWGYCDFDVKYNDCWLNHYVLGGQAADGIVNQRNMFSNPKTSAFAKEDLYLLHS